MVSKHKVLDLIYELIDTLESDWKKPLSELNIWEDVCELYYKVPDTRDANVILAFIILAYDGNSTYLEPHKDRNDNKVRIMKRLAGMNAMANELYAEVVFGLHKVSATIVQWYIDYQKDWRWKDIVATNEYHSKAMHMSMTGDPDPGVMYHIGKMRAVAREEKKVAEKMLSEIRTEFLNLDTILEKENKPKVTDIDKTDFLNHEAWVKADAKSKLNIAILEQQHKELIKYAKTIKKKADKNKANKKSDTGDDEDEDDDGN